MRYAALSVAFLVGCHPAAPAEGELRSPWDEPREPGCDRTPELEQVLDPATGTIPIRRPEGTDGAGPGGPQYWWQERPAIVPGVSEAIQVTVGDQSACALSKNGEVRCWTLHPLPPDEPVTPERKTYLKPIPMAPFTDAKQIAIGQTFGYGQGVCALSGSGSLTCHSFEDERWEPVTAGLGNVVQMSLGEMHGISCAATRRGTVVCWGRSRLLFDEGFDAHRDDIGIARHPDWKDMSRVVVGVGHVCALGQETHCTRDEDGLASWLASLGAVKDVAVFGDFACALTADAIHCRASPGAYEETKLTIKLIERFAPASEIRHLATNGTMACALYTNGHVKCLRDERKGSEYMYPRRESDELVDVPDLVATDLAVGGPICAVTDEGQVACWNYVAAGAQFQDCLPEK